MSNLFFRPHRHLLLKKKRVHNFYFLDDVAYFSFQSFCAMIRYKCIMCQA